MLVNSRLVGELRDSDGRVRYNDIYYLRGSRIQQWVNEQGRGMTTLLVAERRESYKISTAHHLNNHFYSFSFYMTAYCLVLQVSQ